MMALGSTSSDWSTSDRLAELFTSVGLTDDMHVITYCGAGAAGSRVAFVLTLLGVESVALYEVSLVEWSQDTALPMETSELEQVAPVR